MAGVRIKRAYDEAEPGDGYRILIDHVWPRGISRERAHLDEWARELAPRVTICVSGSITSRSALRTSARDTAMSSPVRQSASTCYVNALSTAH